MFLQLYIVFFFKIFKKGFLLSFHEIICGHFELLFLKQLSKFKDSQYFWISLKWILWAVRLKEYPCRVSDWGYDSSCFNCILNCPFLQSTLLIIQESVIHTQPHCLTVTDTQRERERERVSNSQINKQCSKFKRFLILSDKAIVISNGLVDFSPSCFPLLHSRPLSPYTHAPPPQNYIAHHQEELSEDSHLRQTRRQDWVEITYGSVRKFSQTF